MPIYSDRSDRDTFQNLHWEVCFAVGNDRIPAGVLNSNPFEKFCLLIKIDRERYPLADQSTFVILLAVCQKYADIIHFYIILSIAKMIYYTKVCQILFQRMV